MSAIGTKRTSPSALHTSAFGVRADIKISDAQAFFKRSLLRSVGRGCPKPIAPTIPAVICINMVRCKRNVVGLHARFKKISPFFNRPQSEVTDKCARLFEGSISTLLNADLIQTDALPAEIVLFLIGDRTRSTITAGSSFAARTPVRTFFPGVMVRDTVSNSFWHGNCQL